MATIEQEVAAFVEEYGEEFSSADPEVVASHFDVPAMLVTGDGTRTLASRDDVVSFFGAVFEGLESRDYGRSEAEGVDVRAIGPDRALATVDWVRYTVDDDVLERLTTTHLFRETDNGWKMVVLLPHSE